MTKRPKGGLGRGLDALIPSSPLTEEMNERGMLRRVPIASIRPNPHQPRTQFDDAALAELADSIREHGLIQPLIVHEAGPDDYTLIAGERRWRASQRAGLSELPVVVKETTPQGMLELALVENVQRADLNPLEEALAYQQLIEEFGLTQGDVAKRVGKSRPTVANMVRLLDLPANVQEAVAQGRLSGGHARALLALPGPEQQTAVMNSIVQQEWSVRKTEEVVRKLLARKRPAKKQQEVVSAEIRHLEQRFRESLGTKVSIEKGRKGGRVVIHYYSDEELNAIYDAIVGSE